MFSKKFFLVYMIFIIAAFSLSKNVVLASVSDKVKLTGVVYKKFDSKFVQIKDEFGQVLIIPRSSIPKNIKVQEGQIMSFEISPELIRQKK